VGDVSIGRNEFQVLEVVCTDVTFQLAEFQYPGTLVKSAVYQVKIYCEAVLEAG
jgi:hypothetical protein